MRTGKTDLPSLISVFRSLCLSCICLLVTHRLICVTFSLPPGVGGWLRLLLVTLPGLFCLPFLWAHMSLCWVCHAASPIESP